VKGIPSGVERFFGRVKRGGESIMTTITAPSGSSTEKAEAMSRRIGGITVDALGYERERRQLAKHLQVDPYTTNPVLARKLDEFAWVAFSGGCVADGAPVLPSPAGDDQIGIDAAGRRATAAVAVERPVRRAASTIRRDLCLTREVLKTTGGRDAWRDEEEGELCGPGTHDWF
jgi:hypothetical protein